jgi:hypothetical protein
MPFLYRRGDRMKREVISIRSDIQPLGKEYISERVKWDGFIEELRIRFYPGVERELKVKPYLLHKGSIAEDMITYPDGTDPYISGDNDYLVFPVNVPIEYDEFIKVFAENKNATYVYTLSVDVVVQYTPEEVKR